VRSGKLISALVVTGALAIVPSITGTPAHAAGGDLVCRGGFIDASVGGGGGAGITFQSKTVQVTGQGDAGQCTSLTDPSVTGGTFTYQASIQGECPNGGNGNASGTVVWNNGKTSKIQGTFVVDQNQVGMSSIHVLSGEFAGDSGSFAGPITYLPWYQCVFPTGLQYARAIINQAFLN
jgi:hypothetical protein